MQFLAHSVPEDDIHELRGVFESMDTDGRWAASGDASRALELHHGGWVQVLGLGAAPWGVGRIHGVLASSQKACCL